MLRAAGEEAAAFQCRPANRRRRGRPRGRFGKITRGRPPRGMAAWLSYNVGVIVLRRGGKPPRPPGVGGRSLRSKVRGGTSCTAAHCTAPSVARPRHRGPAPRSVRSSPGGRASCAARPPASGPPSFVGRALAPPLPGRRGASLRRRPAAAPVPWPQDKDYIIGRIIHVHIFQILQNVAK